MNEKAQKLKTSDGRLLLEKIETAESTWERMRGLLGRAGLEAGTGLLIKRCRSIHTFGMRFPIDLLYLDRDGVVLGKAAKISPWRCACGPRGTRSVLEMRAGELERLGIAPGQRLVLARISR